MIDDPEPTDWVPLNKRKKLPIGLIMAVACGNLVPGLMYNIIFALLSPTCSILNLNPIVEKMLLLAGSLIGFFIAPFLGILSDRLMLKFGRRRIFVIIGTFVAVLALMLLSFYDKIGEMSSNQGLAKRVIFIVSIILAFISVNIIQSPARVLSSDVTPPAQQNLMSNICQFYNGIAPIISNILGGKQVTVKGLEYTQFLLIISVSISFVAMIICCIFAREEQLKVKPPKTNPFKQTYLAFKKMPKPFSRIILPFLFANMAVYQFQIKFTDFMGSDIFQKNANATDDLDIYQKGVSFAMLCMVVNNACQLVYSFINSKTVDGLGTKWTMLIGNCIMTGSLLTFIWVTERYVYYALAGLIGISQVIFTAIPYATVSLVIPTEELGNNLGILNCFCVIGQQVSNWGMGCFVDAITNNKRSSKKIGFSAVFAAFAAISSIWIIEPKAASESKEQNTSSNTDNSDVSRLSNL